MADLLIELLSEEIPARMQLRAAADLDRLMTTKLADAGLAHGAVSRFVAPRHLAIYVADIDLRQEDVVDERRGPRADAPDQAIAGFLKSTGLSRDQLIEQETPKGTFLFAKIERAGAETADLLPEMITGILNNFPWPKSQRWGTTRFRWVRPLHRVNVVFDGHPLSGSLDLGGDSLAFTAASRGHYFEAPQDIDLTGITGNVGPGGILGPDEYVARLQAAHVMVDFAARRNAINEGAQQLASAHGCTLHPNDDLIDEITGLVEWPSPLFGEIEAQFMDLPDEVLEASIRVHQKYLTTDMIGDKTPDNTENQPVALARGFVVVSNRLPDVRRDAVILAGNQRVLRARLADAQFFFNEDRQSPLASYLPRLADIAFYEGLGSVHDKALRMEKLALVIAPAVAGCDAAVAAGAARLAKADLVTGMVGEFPELQGIMGGYYARLGGESADIADAIAGHYRPQGPADSLPFSPEGLAVSLADKIDSLTGFFGVGAKPTGSKDPFALRRAALGVIRIILESRIRLPLTPLFEAAASAHGFAAVDPDLLAFIRERLRVSLRDAGIAHDVIAAAFGDLDTALHDDLLGLADRAAALSQFLQGEDGAGLLAGWRRAASILNAEESKSKQTFAPETNPALFVVPAEGDLHAALTGLSALPSGGKNADLLLQMMRSLGGLQGPIDSFFDRVVVNDHDASIRQNRLGLLAMVRDAMQRVADFSKLEG